MTLDYLQGTYTTYKKDTDAITNWLATTAKRCGFSPEVLKDNDNASGQPPSQPPPEIKSPKLQGRARKLARDAAPKDGTKSERLRTYTIPVRSLTQLASQIVSSATPSIKVPAILGTILDRAIAFRKEHNACFKNTKLATETPSNIDSHAHFISVPECVRHILRPYMAEKIGTAPLKQSQAHSKRANENKTRNQNAFEVLDVEELSEDFLNTSLSEKASKHKPGSAQTIRYKAECMSKDDEHIIAGLVLLHSSNKIRKHIEGLWKAYLTKDIDLHAAAVSTNTAIEVVRHLQEDHDKSFHNQPDFQACLVPCFLATCRLLNVNVLRREQPHDLYNFAPVERECLETCFINTWHMLAQLRAWRAPDKIACVDYLVPKCRDTATDWSQKSNRDKLLDDRFMLFRAFTELGALATMDRWVEDEFVRGVRDMSPDKPIPLWLAFAAQVYLDVQHTLGAEVGSPYEEMQKGGMYMKSALDQTVAFHEKLSRNLLNPIFCIQIREHMHTTGELIDFMLISDLVDWRINGTNIKRLPSFEFFQHNPIMCGLYLFGGRYTMQRSSILCVKDWTTTIYCTHLYNALRVQLLAKRWEDMETLLKLQGRDRIFMGAAPQSITECVKRFKLCMGTSIINSASDRTEVEGKG